MRVAARSIGVLAARALAQPGRAKVLAAFERSVYLEAPGGTIVVAASDLHDGPLNLRLRLPIVPQSAPGDRWIVELGSLRRSDGLAIDLDPASIWRPPSSIQTINPNRLRRGLNHLRDLAAKAAPSDDGLMRLASMEAPPRTATERAAAPLLAELKRTLIVWLVGEPTRDIDPAFQLLGLGPGLTPSGDDLLAGLMIAWRRMAPSAALERLVRRISLEAPRRTTPISRLHLAAAAEGLGAAPLHDLLEGLIAGDRDGIARALDAAGEIGHSSGFDAIGGVLIMLTAWLDSEEQRPAVA